MLQFVVIRKMAAGNEQVSEMWDETIIMDEKKTLLDVLEWAGTKKQVIITLSDNSIDDWNLRKDNKMGDEIDSLLSKK